MVGMKTIPNINFTIKPVGILDFIGKHLKNPNCGVDFFYKALVFANPPNPVTKKPTTSVLYTLIRTLDTVTFQSAGWKKVITTLQPSLKIELSVQA